MMLINAVFELLPMCRVYSHTNKHNRRTKRTSAVGVRHLLHPDRFFLRERLLICKDPCEEYLMQSDVGLPRDTLVNAGVNKSLGGISGIGGNEW